MIPVYTMIATPPIMCPEQFYLHQLLLSGFRDKSRVHEFVSRVLANPATAIWGRITVALQHAAEGDKEESTQIFKSISASNGELLFECYRIQSCLLSGEFAEINALLESIPFHKYRNEPDALLYMMQIAITCGLLAVGSHIYRLLNNPDKYLDVYWALYILDKNKISPSLLASAFLLAKNHVRHQSGTTVLNCGYSYCIADGGSFQLQIYLDTQDVAVLADTGISLTERLVDFEYGHKADLGCVSVDVRAGGL
ncbi:cyclin family protein [Paralysiella testudinis]|uniref:Uncharacterized protein n=1 Tax=Paralysiella testudinis TaxID=2809020 RepID=A0A892ZK73_9NEIS|nr:hypothetical protein [Paralysiella testudinis]QRQ82860.1 hypothetical protein JQU52_05630 [Paralysiella testudinis]